MRRRIEDVESDRGACSFAWLGGTPSVVQTGGGLWFDEATGVLCFVKALSCGAVGDAYEGGAGSLLDQSHHR